MKLSSAILARWAEGFRTGPLTEGEATGETGLMPLFDILRGGGRRRSSVGVLDLQVDGCMMALARRWEGV